MIFKARIFLVNLLITMLVSGRTMTSKRYNSDHRLPASDEQKQFLAESVCIDLQWYLETDEALQECKENYRWYLDSNTSGFQMGCLSNLTATYEVVPSKHYQLVLLIPDPNNNDPYSLVYSIIQPDTKYGEVTMSPGTTYNTYFAVLNKHGRPYKWHKESKITGVIPPYKKYDLQVTFSNANITLDGLLTWNQIDEFDICFELVTKCGKDDMLVTNIRPGSPLKLLMKELPLNVSCNVQLTGLYGLTEYTFHTPAPSTTTTEIPNDLDYPKLVSVDAKEDGAGWTVKVKWTKPRLTPDSYNVTLRADENTTIVVAGNATEATFWDITGQGFYNISVYAILGNEMAVTTRQAVFLISSGHSVRRWAEAAGGAWGAAALGTVAAMLCWLRIRRSGRIEPPVTPPCIKPYIPLFKPQPSSPAKIIAESDKDPEAESNKTDVWEVKSERVLLHEVIGEGAFGVVRRGTLAPHGREVAVKMLKDFPSLDEMRSFHLEMELMKSVRAHPHVVSLVGCCSETRPLIIAEYCSQGDLLSFLRRSWDVMISKRNALYYNNNIDISNYYKNDLFKWKVPQEHSNLVINKMYDLQGPCNTDLTPLDLLSFCRQIAKGMEFLASNRVVHRDLAARNILVTGDRTLKIADFGLSRDVYEENQYKQKGNGKMPVKWMALESLTRRIYTTQSDVWSFGVVLWEVLTVGGSPYPHVSAAKLPRLLRAGYRMPRPLNCTEPLYDVMLSCWHASPRERPTFADLHARLDELLHTACANDYLSLELDDADEPPPPSPKASRYFKIFVRAKRYLMRGEIYERPLKAHNYYTSTPVCLTKSPV